MDDPPPTPAAPTVAPVAQAPWHPFLFSTFIVTSLYAANCHETPFADLPVPLLTTVGLTGLGLLVARPIYRSWTRAALAASLVLVAFFTYYHFHTLLVALLSGLVDRVRYRYSLISWAAIIGGGLLALFHRRVAVAEITEAANRLGLMLVLTSLGWAGFSLGRLAWVQAGQEPPAPRSAAMNTAEEVAITLTPPAQPRDIYYLIFDRYADNPTLRAAFEHDNEPFYAALRKRGFVCAARSRTNYPKTVIAMSAALNLRYHDHARIRADTYYGDLIDDHRVGRLLKQAGYRYHHVGNWNNALRRNKNADVNFHFARHTSEFTGVLRSLTPLRLFQLAGAKQQLIRRQFEAIEGAAQPGQPTFVYAHFILPHPPFVFDRDGSTLSEGTAALRSKAENYANQLVFTNQRILTMVDRLLAKPGPRPILVIQADEGPDLFGHPPMKRLDAIRHRSGIISAFLLPDRDAAALVSPDITPVNTFRLIFRSYFGMKLGLLEDRTFYWSKSTPGGMPDRAQAAQFVDVTAELR